MTDIPCAQKKMVMKRPIRLNQWHMSLSLILVCFWQYAKVNVSCDFVNNTKNWVENCDKLFLFESHLNKLLCHHNIATCHKSAIAIAKINALEFDLVPHSTYNQGIPNLKHHWRLFWNIKCNSLVLLNIQQSSYVISFIYANLS